MRNLFLLFFLFIVLSCSESEKEKPHGKGKEMSPYGNWIVTKCLSGNLYDPRVGLDEVARNLGGKMEISKNVIVEQLNGTNKDTVNLSLLFQTINARNYCGYCDDIVSKSEGGVAKYIGYSKVSLTVIQTTEEGYLDEIVMLDSNQILLTVDGFFLFLDRFDEQSHSEVVVDKLAFYSDNSMAKKLNYYCVKGDKISAYIRQDSICFIEYSNEGSHYFGWVYTSDVR